MDLEGIVDLSGADMEEKEAPKFVEIGDPNIPPDTHPIESETDPKAEFEVPYAPEVPTPATVESLGIRRSTHVRPQWSTYTTSMEDKIYSCAMMQLESQGVIHPDAHMLAQED